MTFRSIKVLPTSRLRRPKRVNVSWTASHQRWRHYGHSKFAHFQTILCATSHRSILESAARPLWEPKISQCFCYFISPSDDVVLSAIELRPPVGLLHHSQTTGMEHWWNDNWRVKIEVKSSKSQKKLPHLPLFPQKFSYGLFWDQRRASAIKLHAWITVVHPDKKLQQFLISVHCLECDTAARCEWRQHKVHL